MKRERDISSRFRVLVSSSAPPLSIRVQDDRRNRTARGRGSEGPRQLEQGQTVERFHQGGQYTDVRNKKISQQWQRSSELGSPESTERRLLDCSGVMDAGSESPHVPAGGSNPPGGMGVGSLENQPLKPTMPDCACNRNSRENRHFFPGFVLEKLDRPSFP